MQSQVSLSILLARRVRKAKEKIVLVSDVQVRLLVVLELNQTRSHNVQAIMRFDMSMSLGRYLLNII